MAAGDFTPTKLAEVQLRVDQMWAEPQTSKNYTANGESVKAVLENQTATISALEDPEKLKEVAVKWIDFCGDTSRDTQHADQCPIDEACGEGEGKTKSYALDIFIEDCFAVREEDLETSIFSMEDVIAKGMLAKQKNILERFNTKTIAAIDAGKGDSPYAGAGTIGTENLGYTEITTANYTIDKIYPYWMQVMALQRSNSAFLLDGGNFFQQWILAQKTAANDNGKLSQGLVDMLNYYQDLFGFAKAGVASNTYLVDKGAVAIANRAKFPVTPKEYGHGVAQTRYSIPLAQLPQLKLDVTYTNVCDADTILHKWNMKLRAGVFVNPTMCDAGNTGILGFKKVA